MTNRHDWPLTLSVIPANFTDEWLAAMQQAGIRQMELSIGYFPQQVEQVDYLNRSKEIRDHAASYGVDITSIHLPFGPFETMDPTDSDPEKREFVFKTLTDIMKAAADSGITLAVIHPSGEPYEEAERSRRITAGIDMISRLNTVAKELGMTLALENLPRLCLCRTHDEMESFLQAIPDLRVCFDTNHNLVESNAEYIRAVGDRIVTIHVSDYDFVDERHWLPMEGKNDWEEILSVLEEVGYAGRFVYELHSGPTPQDVADNYQKLMQL